MTSSTALIVLCFVCCLYNVIAEGSPTLSYISKTEIKDVGDTVELHCNVQSDDNPVIWMKVDKDNSSYNLVISKGISVTVPFLRYSVRYIDNSDYILRIEDIEKTDVGIYSCQVLIPSNASVAAEVDLQVRIPPFIFNSTRSIGVTEGKDVQLECYAGGYPTPTISWRRENNVILPNGSSYNGNILKIKSIRKEDRGTYYCVAENGVGRGTKRSIDVQIEVAPIVVVPFPRLGQALQFDMNIVCHVEAYPPPAITWEKNNVTLSFKLYRISNFAMEDQLTASVLRVSNIEKKDYGQYVCKAVNKLGTAEGTVELYETKTPDRSSNRSN